MALRSDRLVVRLAEYIPKEHADALLRGTRGIYALFRHRGTGEVFDVVYVGLSKTGIRARLRTHRRKKAKLWTHFSVFEVHPDATDEQIAELEGLFRHIYRRDTRANRLNKQKTHAPLKALRIQDLGAWEPRKV
jgi:hypothetical protein